MSREAVILGGARTPIGKFGGSLRPLSAVELGAQALGGRYGLAAICGNGGHGASVAVERVG